MSSPTIRENLLAFHKRWYSSNLTSLCITGKYDIATMEKWVTEKFSPIVNKQIVVPPLGDPTPFPAERLGKLVTFVPIKDDDTLTFAYVLPYCENDFETQPLGYFSALIGHEGENSLLSYLKHEDLALELSAGPDHTLDCMSMFEIEVTLTKKGLQNWEQVIEITFKYLNNIREAGPQEYFFNECKDIGELSFKYADKKEAYTTCVGLARRIHQFTDENVGQLERSKYVVDKFD
jgi:insulysin